MKVISIGRNPDCNIVYDDNMVSRRHALLKIYPTGKYEIVSTGTNGTKVNGNQITPNQPYPVKRGDSVTFAHVAQLDWRMVPDPLKPYKIGALAVLAALAIVAICVFVPPLFGDDSYDDNSGTGGSGTRTEQTDSTATGGKVQADTLNRNVRTLVPPAIERPDKAKAEKDKKKKETKAPAADSKKGKAAKADKKNAPSDSTSGTWKRL